MGFLKAKNRSLILKLVDSFITKQQMFSLILRFYAQNQLDKLGNTAKELILRRGF